MSRHPNPFGPDAREADGITATLTRGDEVRSLTLPGIGPRLGLLHVIAVCDTEGYRIRTISTPTSILGDFRGRTPRGRNNKGQQTPRTPEMTVLGQVGRLALLETP